MNETYKYEIEDGCFMVINTETNTRRVLSNFTAKIVKEEKYVYDDGSAISYYYIEGKTQQGKVLKPIEKLSVDDYNNGNWFQTLWGDSAKLLDLGDTNKALIHLLCAICRLSQPIPSETKYEQTGVVVDPSGQPKPLFANGAVTAEGIDSTSYSGLSEQLNFFQLLEHTNDDEKTKEAIKAVFNLLDFSENPYLGLVLCLAAIRASISMWLPIGQFIFLVSQRDTINCSAKIMEIIQSFFSAANKQTQLVNWGATINALKEFARTANNCVLCVNDFVYPDASNRKYDSTFIAEQFLWAVTSGLSKSRANSQGRVVENTTRLNCLVVSAGEFPPGNLPEFLHQRGIYVPYKDGDINIKALTKLLTLAEDGTFELAYVAFIQYLMADYEKNLTRAEKWFAEARETNNQKYQLNNPAARNMAGLVVGWAFFRKFAMSRGVITEAESKAYRVNVNKHLGNLMSEQKEIYTSNPGHLFIKRLRQALKNGKAHLIDSQTGLQPEKILSSKVGWDGNMPNGLWIGWRDAKKGEVFIRGNLDTEELINLLPEQDRHLYSKGATKFWKDLKADGVLNCPEDDRNTTRQVLADTEERNNYRLEMVIRRTPKTSKPEIIKPIPKPDKPKHKPEKKGNAIQIRKG